MFRTRIKSYVLFCIGLCALLVNAPTIADDTQTVQAYLDKTTSIKAQFVQTVMSDTGIVSEIKEGEVVILKPGQFRWDYAGEYPQVIGSDGQKVWIHDVALRQVSVRPIDNAMALSPAAILSGTTPVADIYNLEFIVEQDDVRWLRLQPKTPSDDLDYQDVQLGFRGEQLVIMRLVDNFSNVNDIEFTNIQTNVPVDVNIFAINVADDVDVVGDF